MWRQGDLVWVELPKSAGTGGHEQIGRRPAAIAQVDDEIGLTPMVVVIPFTSNRAALRYPRTFRVRPTPENELREDSVAMVFQMRAIDSARIVGRLGRLGPDDLAMLKSQMKALLGL